jgi:hypothetical protein
MQLHSSCYFGPYLRFCELRTVRSSVTPQSFTFALLRELRVPSRQWMGDVTGLPKDGAWHRNTERLCGLFTRDMCHTRVCAVYWYSETNRNMVSIMRWRRPSSGMWRRVALVRTDNSEERVTIIRLERLGELGITLAVTSNWSTLRTNTKYCSWIADYFQPDNRGNTFLWNVGSNRGPTASHPRRRHSS